MSEAQAQALEAHLKKTTIVSNFLALIVAVFTAMFVGYGFYYKTESTLSDHTLQLMEMKKDVKNTNATVQNLNLGNGISDVQIQSMEDKIKKIENSLDRFDEKLDRVLFQTR